MRGRRGRRSRRAHPRTRWHRKAPAGRSRQRCCEGADRRGSGGRNPRRCVYRGWERRASSIAAVPASRRPTASGSRLFPATFGEARPVAGEHAGERRRAAVSGARLGRGVEAGDDVGENLDGEAIEATGGGDTVENGIGGEAGHDHQPVDRLALAADGKSAAFGADDRHAALVEHRRRPPVDLAPPARTSAASTLRSRSPDTASGRRA